MCGIAGIYNINSKVISSEFEKENRRVLKQMTNKLIHRGPDDEGFFVNNRVAIGHRRLSIIDLSSAGHQPMFSFDKTLAIVFNGEIYNYIELREELVEKGHIFRTETDTEVILASYKQWGKKCLDHFNGMWAFALYDFSNEELFCARDRLGVKPFYYYCDRNIFVFASEPKALLVHPEIKPLVNEQSVWDYLMCGHLDHREETFFKGIKELKGGFYLEIKSASKKIVTADKILKISQYWDLPKKEINISDAEANRVYSQLIHDSIKLRLRSDVPIGTCLSGGLDSSAITCIVNELLKNQGVKQTSKIQKTFSAVYDPKKFPKCDERKFINVVNRKTKASSNFIFPDGEKLAKDLENLIYSQDFPFGSTSIYAQYSVFKLAKNKKVKVMLDGQGVDELLAGYHTFFPVFFRSLKEKGQYLKLFREIVDFNRNHGNTMKYAFFRLLFPTNLFAALKNKISFNLKNAYYNAYFDYNVFNQEWRQKYLSLVFPTPNNNPFKDQSYLLTRIQGLPSLLRYEDRNSMNFSIESRTPFLDYRLVEFVYSLPDDQKIRHGQTKWVMRQALKGVLPEKIRNRQDKVGFATPEEIWFKKNLAPQMRKVFASEKFASRPYFDHKKVILSFEKFLSGEPIMYQLFWRIYNLELWLRRFID
jgi:asparagine synthase (glutamine-hydrolysing)